MRKIVNYIGLFLLLCLPIATHAGPILRSGESVSVDSTQELGGDFYGAGSDITISGNAQNDAYLLGGSITVNAPVKEDLTVLGGLVQVHGEVGDDVRVVGGEVTIAKPVHGDVVVFGSKLTILSTATVAGDVLFYGEALTIEGEVSGGIHGTAENVRINNIVGGDVSVTVLNTFSLGDMARVQGNITYKSVDTLERAQNAQVAGEVHQFTPTSESNRPLVEFLTFEFFVLLFTTLSLYIFMRSLIHHIIQSTEHSVGVYGLIGLALFVAVPVIAVVLIMSIVGILLGIILLTAYLLLLICALLLASILIGHAVGRLVFHAKQITALIVGFGVGLLVLLSFVPYIGGFLVFACTMIALGKITFAIYGATRG